MDTTGFLTLDYIVIGIIAVSTLFAFIRGFIGSLLSLTGWVLSIYLAYHFYPAFKPILEPKIKNEIALLLAGHSILLLGFIVFFGIFNLFATKIVKGLTSGIIDRFLGAGFGVLRGGIIVSFFFFIAMSAISISHGSDDSTKESEDKIAPSWLKDSKSYPYLKEGRDILKDFIPDTFNKRIEVVFNDLSKKNMDERFVETALEKLDQSLTKEQKEALLKKVKENSLTQSTDTVEHKKLKELLDLYKGNLADGTVKEDSSLSSNEIKRIENILNEDLESTEGKEIVEKE